MERSKDWLEQAERDLEVARWAFQGSYYEWVCFICQQAAEKALKAVYQSLHREAWGHSVMGLLERLPVEPNPSEELLEMGAVLDRYYVPPRCPNSFASGAPLKYYTKADGEQAISHAGELIRYCKGLLS